MNIWPDKRTLSRLLLFGAPLLLWLWTQRCFWTEGYFAGGDNSQYYYWLTYFLKQLAGGVVPFWNPFHAFGSIDNFEMRCLGDANPFYLLILGMKAAGASSTGAFLIFSIFYFFLGLLGFFFLARRLLKDEGLAFLAYVLLMFSTLGITLFLQMIVVLIFVPAVWFFFCAVGFQEETSPREEKTWVLGMTFCVMLLLITYLPFFWVTVTLGLGVALILVWPQALWGFLKKLFGFCQRHPGLAVLCLFALAAASFPALSWHWDSKDPFYVFHIGRNLEGDVLGVPLETINMGGIASEASFLEFFSGLDIAAQQFAYVPIFVFVLFFLSVLTRLKRFSVVLFVAAFFVFLLALADVTPIQGFLYRHVRFFQLFRNYFFFCSYILAIAILFLVSQLKSFLDEAPRTPGGRWASLVYVVVCHGLFLGFLFQQQDVIAWTSCLTVFLSMIFFCLWIAGLIRPNSAVFLAGLVMLAVLQPLEILPGFKLLYTSFRPAAETLGSRRPVAGSAIPSGFSYLRPRKGQGQNEDHAFHYRTKISEDESGFAKEGYYGVRGSYELHKNIPFEALQEYVRHKFIIYDQTQYLDPESMDWARLARNLAGLVNTALVQDRSAVGQNAVSSGSAPQAQVFEGPSFELTVTRFDVNRIVIRTRFSSRKFLVYNDSYHPDWRATINGKPARLVRANGAFKGLWVEAGPQRIVMRFRSVWAQVFALGLMVFFLGWLIALIVLCGKKICKR